MEVPKQTEEQRGLALLAWAKALAAQEMSSCLMVCAVPGTYREGDVLPLMVVSPPWLSHNDAIQLLTVALRAMTGEDAQGGQQYTLSIN